MKKPAHWAGFFISFDREQRLSTFRSVSEIALALQIIYLGAIVCLSVWLAPGDSVFPSVSDVSTHNICL